VSGPRVAARRAAAPPREPPLLLLPPSKGKAEGGDGPAYGTTLADGDHPLAAARREVLAAIVAAVPGLADGPLVRLAGVRARDVDLARDLLTSLPDAPTLPARQRYTGVVHGNAGLAARASGAAGGSGAAAGSGAAGAEVLIVSPLLGSVGLDEPVPHYRLELGASLPGLGGLGTFWRDRLASHLAAVAAGRRVWDLLPAEHARVWPPAARGEVDVVVARFVRPDGRAANAARTKVAKGRLAAHLRARPDEAPATIDAGVLGPGWRVGTAPGALVATWVGDADPVSRW
jgi:uncharacterized protein